jgi:NTE family protein
VTAGRSVTGGDRIALALADGGARGAFEAGALAVILPELDHRG